VIVAAVVGGLFAFSTATSAPAQIRYHERAYTNMVKVNAIEVRAHIGTLRPTGDRIDGDAVFVTAGIHPQVVALELARGEYDAYQLPG
jgi:hypothetical protein